MKAEVRYREMMVEAIKIIASDFETQVKAFPDYVSIPDEVVSTFDEALRVFDQVIDANLVNEIQSKAVYEIDKYLEKMNEKKDYDNQWTLASMQSSPDWQHLRLLGNDLLALLGVSDKTPKLGWVTYIRHV